ncbi:MAG: 30S ribosomal protein S17e [Candidatus Aenigmatarchaeota archaeon]
MGRVVTKDIKNVAEKILEQHREKFSEDYEKNKQVLNQLYSFLSKKLRNKVAGYITFLIKKQKNA